MYLLAMLLTVVMWLQPAEVQSTRKANPTSQDAVERYLWLAETFSPELKSSYELIKFHPSELTIDRSRRNAPSVDEVRQEFISARSWFDELIEATELNASSLAAIEPSRGTLRAPVASEISITRLSELGDALVAHATFAWAEGQDDAALRSLHAAFRLAKHIGAGANPFQFNVAIEISLFRRAIHRGIEMLESDSDKTRLTPQERQAWCQAFASHGDPQPFAFKDAVVRHVEAEIAWAEARIKDDGVSEDLLLAIADVAMLPPGELAPRIREVNPGIQILPENHEKVLNILRAEPRCKPEALRAAQADARLILQEVSRRWESITREEEFQELVGLRDGARRLWPTTLSLAPVFWSVEQKAGESIAKLRILCGCTTPEHAP